MTTSFDVVQDHLKRNIILETDMHWLVKEVLYLNDQCDSLIKRLAERNLEVERLQMEMRALDREYVVLDMPPKETYTPDMNTKTETYTDTNTIADEVGVPETTIRRLCRDGKLHAVRIGRGWRIRRSDWAAYLAAQDNQKGQ